MGWNFLLFRYKILHYYSGSKWGFEGEANPWINKLRSALLKPLRDQMMKNVWMRSENLHLSFCENLETFYISLLALCCLCRLHNQHLAMYEKKSQEEMIIFDEYTMFTLSFSLSYILCADSMPMFVNFLWCQQRLVTYILMTEAAIVCATNHHRSAIASHSEIFEI